MKKNLTAYLAIFASLVFAFSCAKEEGGQEVPITPDTITVSLSLDENDDDNNKSEFTDSRGLQWTNTDVLRWISADGTKTATSTNISITNKGYNATFTIEIPGLSGANQTGHFTVNSEDNGSFKFTKSGLSGTDMTIAQEEIGKMNSAYTFLHSGKDITITKGTTSLTDDQVKLAMAGSIIRAIPYTTTHNDEQVLSIGICSNDNVAGTIAYTYTTSGSTSSGITADQAKKYLVNLTAPFSLEGVTDKNSSHAIYIPVPTTTIGGYRITVETDQAYYMFESDDNLVLTENKVRNVSLNLDNSAVTPSSKNAIIELSASNISSNYPMEYVSQNIGCNDYGFDGNLDVNQKLEGYRETARRAKFGEPANMWDNDLTTSYHTNTDFSPTSGTWGFRSPYGYDGCVPNTYIQVTLPSFVTSLNVDLTTQASGISGTGWVKSFGDTGMKIEVCDTDGNWETYGDFSNKGKGYGENVSIENIALSNSRLISAIRFKNNVATSDWTGRNVAFGIAELELEGYGVKEPAYVRHVKSVSVSPDSKTLDVTENVQLTATVLPENATDKSVTWSSSDNNVATVSNTGLVTANAGGTATITATSVDGGIKATCNITVNTPVSPHKTYVIGEKHRDMQFNSPNYTKFPTHHFTQSGNLENYVEIVQGGVSYYTTSTSGWPTATIDGLSVVTAITGGGEDFVIPGYNITGTMFTWVTSDGGLLPGKEIRANTEMSITNDTWKGETYGVTSYLTTGSTYASIVYSRSSTSAKWKLIEVTKTKPE